MHRAEVVDNMQECLHALEKEKKRGTIRAFGLSNETAWGMAQWLRLAEEGHGPRAATIQNEYSLLCRLFDTDLAELCMLEDVGLMAYSPLGAGLLTGKYQGRAKPPGSRMSLNGDLGGRATKRVFPAVDDYLDVAFKHDLDMVSMCLAWAAQRRSTPPSSSAPRRWNSWNVSSTALTCSCRRRSSRISTRCIARIRCPTDPTDRDLPDLIFG